MRWQGVHLGGKARIAARQVALRLRAVAAMLARLWSRPAVQVVLVMVPLAIFLRLTPVGDYLERSLFVLPLQRARLALGIEPRFDERLRLIVVDDSSLKKIGRFPTFGEWQRIADLLGSLGVERVLLYGFHNLRTEIGDLAPRPSGTRLFAAMTLVASPQNALAYPVAELAHRLQLPIDATATHLPDKAMAPVILGPAPAAFAALDGVGDLGADEGGLMRYATRTRDDAVIPNLAFRAAASLAWVDGAFVTEAGRFPRSLDDRLHPEFVASERVGSRRIPASAFFTRAYEAIIGSAPPKLVELLQGAKVAILIPQGQTGQRFVDGPSGLVPSYMAFASLVNGVLANRALFVPISTPWLLAAWILLLAFILSRSRFAVAIIATAGATILLAGSSLFAFHALGWILPAAEMGLVVFAGTTHRVLAHMIAAVTDRKALARDLELGSLTQTYFLPDALSGAVGAWEYHIVYKPYGAMSGDWVQIHSTPRGAPQPCTVIAIGDVVGKGASAALATALIAGVWRSFSDRWETEPVSLPELIIAIDRMLERTFKGQVNSTLSLALLTEERAVITFFGAPPFAKLGSDGVVTRLKAPARSPLGARLPLKYREIECRPAAGDLLVAYTDGVIDGNLAYHVFERELTQTPMPDTAKVFEVVADVARRAGSSSALPDDFTLLMIRRLAPVPSMQDKSAV